MSEPREAEPFKWMGLFAPIFDDGHYLSFLNLNQPAEAIAALRAIVAGDAPGLEANVIAILDPALAGWRPQLIGASAMLLGVTTPATLAALWRALEQPSWVSPQLAVTAYLRAPDFAVRARARIEGLCRVDASEIRKRRGEDENRFPDFEDGKQLGAMIALCKTDGVPDWLAPLEISQAGRDVLATSRDDGADLALGWLERVRSHIDSPA